MPYDYIVIGAGSAGCVVTNRLSASGASVLLLEAGGPDEEQGIHIPAAFPTLFKTPFDWAYETVPQTHCNNRTDYIPRGKVFGGSSSINAMIYQRGAPANFNRWAEMGNEGWGWDDVLTYYHKAQNQERGASAYHAVGGPMNVADLRDPNPLSQAMVKACEEQNLPLNHDFNGETQVGFGLYQVTQKNGMRHSAAVGYLHLALTHENLTAIPHAQVVKLTFDGRRCTGAVYWKDGTEHQAVASKEVILCGGAINSPHLLMLSGIGPKTKLAEFGIPVLIDLPGVGKNLQDHLMVPVAYHVTKPISLAHAESEEQVRKLTEEGKGLLTSNIGEAGGFLTINPDADAPDLQFHFSPTWFVHHGFNNPEGDGMTLLPGVVGTKSVGNLTIQSADPDVPPLIDPNYLAEEADMNVLVEGVKIARKIMNSSAFDEYRGGEYLPGTNVQTDEEIKAFIRNYVQNIYHPVGTCKMGNDPMAVVNERLQVQGLNGLRIADASIMPFIINANTNNPCIMIGEKCADMVLGFA